MIRVHDSFERGALDDWVVGKRPDAARAQDAPGLVQGRTDGSGRMPDAAALLADLFERLAVDDVVLAVVDVPTELKPSLEDENIFCILF